MNDIRKVEDSSPFTGIADDYIHKVPNIDGATVTPTTKDPITQGASGRRESSPKALNELETHISQRSSSSRHPDRQSSVSANIAREVAVSSPPGAGPDREPLSIPGLKYINSKKTDNRNSLALGSPTSGDLDFQSSLPTKELNQNPPLGSSSTRRIFPPNTAEITYRSHKGSIKRVILKNSETTIGRKLESDISLHCPKISKLHAIIKKIDGNYVILDTKSSNGVKINDRHIPQSSPIALKNEDRIVIGPYILIFRCQDPEKLDQVPRPQQENYSTDQANEIEDSMLNFVNNEPPQKKYDNSKSLDREFNRRAQKTMSILDSSKKKTATDDNHRYTKLVTILPSEKKYEGSVTIKAEIPAEPDTEFKPFSEVESMETIQEDYEKLRLAYELSKSFSLGITEALSKSCEIMFEILPLDRAVVLLVDNQTRMLVTHYVRVRKGGLYSQREIRLSSTILRKVYHSRKALITSDAFEDPILNRHASVKHGQIRSVICVPLMTRDKVLGVLHLDSRNRIASLNKKDLSLVIAVGSQTALAIENSILVKEVETKARLTEQFSRFLPPYVVDKMTKNKGEGISKGGRETYGTIIFSDIRGFTSLSERTVPSEVVNLLNDYFERLVAIVFKYNGVVDKYIGDALMAAFGTMEHECLDSEFRAVSAALEFKKAIEEMNEERKKVNRESIAVGIGINTGELLAGFIGCSQRLEYTCIGDTVNTSSRICSMAGMNQVLMSQTTWEAVKDRVVSMPVGYRQFKGKYKEVMVYEPLYVKIPQSYQ